MTSLADRPEDVLREIFALCSARDFLAVCQTCKTLYEYRQDPRFWRTRTSEAFRLPISPLLKADGARWFHLYRRLKTQTRLYTWGQGLHGNLGRGIPRRVYAGRFRRQIGLPPPGGFERSSSSWPTHTIVPKEIDVIADLQCGGWSTSILSSSGKIYVAGLISDMHGRYRGESTDRFTELKLPPGPPSTIRQFSSGRFHILGLTDEGEILTWDRIAIKGLKVFSRRGVRFRGRPARVVAGWGQSSAYVPELGIVYWTPPRDSGDFGLLDGVHVAETTIPGTARFVEGRDTGVDVVSHVTLEDFIVWVTSEAKVYACALAVKEADDSVPASYPFELPGYNINNIRPQDVQGQYNKFAILTDSGEVLAGNTDYLKQCAQGAKSNPSFEDAHVPEPTSLWVGLDALVRKRPVDNAALQHSGVISLAFGDHHYHALHANGRLTSYGHEPESCGALGFGDIPSGARLRGLTTDPGFRPDSRLVAHAESRGRDVWFEPEKRDWLSWLEQSCSAQSDPVPQQNFQRLGNSQSGHRERAIDVGSEAFGHWIDYHENQLMYSEWVQQEGQHWNEGPIGLSATQNLQATDSAVTEDFHLAPYFVISAAAAGWHSGALILVDDELAQKTREKWLTQRPAEDSVVTAGSGEEVQKYRIPGHFETEPNEPEEVYTWTMGGPPRIELPDGRFSPGNGVTQPWREGIPMLADLFPPSAEPQMAQLNIHN